MTAKDAGPQPELVAAVPQRAQSIPAERKPTPQEKWRERNPVAAWAHSALRSALKRGLVEAHPCEDCGATPAEAHHADYERPLRVEWLCRRCHKQRHRKGAANV